MYVATGQSVYYLLFPKYVYEKEMVRQLENYFEDILSPYISGFRKTHCCDSRNSFDPNG